MTVLVLAEHNNQNLKPATLNVIHAANQLSDSVVILVAGYQCQAVVESLQSIAGITHILVADHEQFEHPLAESFAPLIQYAIQQQETTHVLAPATTFGKNILPRVAALLDVGLVSDVIEILDENTFKRPMYAGNVISTVTSQDSLKLLTIRVTAFSSAEKKPNEAKVITIDFQVENKLLENKLSRFVKLATGHGDRPELSSADIIISGGRGLQNEETFNRLTAIADRLGAAIGASRAAVDAGLAPNDLQVGQTGQVVAPKLYIAVGISGAIQHLAGMKDSKIIVAINKDPDAPIFQLADYGLVDDVFKVLPEWERVLTEMGY